MFCDIGYHVYHEQNVPETELKSVPRCLVHTTVFQLIASLALPAFIIHSGERPITRVSPVPCRLGSAA